MIKKGTIKLYLFVTLACLGLAAGLSYVLEETRSPDVEILGDGSVNVIISGRRKRISREALEEAFGKQTRPEQKETPDKGSHMKDSIDKATLDKLRKIYGDRFDNDDYKALKNAYDKYKKGESITK